MRTIHYFECTRKYTVCGFSPYNIFAKLIKLLNKTNMEKLTIPSVSYSHPRNCIQLIDKMGTDARVVNAARVSFQSAIPEHEALKSGDAKLIRYLATHHHTSPFFHPVVCFRIKMPIFVAREWFRHTVGFARNEVSRRYVTRTVECFLPDMIREKHPSKKQGSKDEAIPENDKMLVVMKDSMEKAIETYETLLKHGTAPEIARMVLPQSMMTEFIETASLAAYARLYELRFSSDAQLEIREYARIIGETLKKEFPVSWAALVNEINDTNTNTDH